MEGVEHVPLTKDKAVQLVKDVFISAAERDVYTGDALRVCVITKEGINEETIPLRKDWGGNLLFPSASSFSVWCTFILWLWHLYVRFLKTGVLIQVATLVANWGASFLPPVSQILQFSCSHALLCGLAGWSWITTPILRSKFFTRPYLDPASVMIFHYVFKGDPLCYSFYILNKCKEFKSLLCLFIAHSTSDRPVFYDQKNTNGNRILIQYLVK